MPTPENPIFKVSPNAVFDTFEDEVVVINMVNGIYFTLDAAALDIWARLQARQPLHKIVAATQHHYQGDPGAIESAVNALVDELEQEGLIVRAEDEALEAGTPAGDMASGSISPAPESADSDGNRPVFKKPSVTKFTDIQELMLLDPIHEVDDTGWPHAKTASPSEDQSDSPK